MPNPVLNDQAVKAAARAGWAAPPPPSGYQPGLTDGPISVNGLMTKSGAMTATGVLFAILLVFAGFGWNAVKVTEGEVTGFPAWTMIAMLVAFGLTFLLRFKPTMARFIAPAYAALEGLVIGAISHVYETTKGGIVFQAVGATLGVAAVMLFLYKFNIIKVNDKYRRIVGGAVMGVMLFYLVSFVLSLFNVNVPLVNSSSNVGILFSLFTAGVAAARLGEDFDNVERYANAGMPKYMEWYAGFGIMVTMVWLYLEMLRLLSKLQRR